MSKPCEYCGRDLPLGVDKKTRQQRSHHFATYKARPVPEVDPFAQRKGLTDEEIDRLWSQSLADTEGETWLPLREFARAIEAKLKEKNT